MLRFLFLLSLSLLFLGRAKAQSLDTLPWCPAGAVWVYQYNAMSIGIIPYFVMSYEEDSLIDNKTVKKISKRVKSYSAYGGTVGNPVFDFYSDTLLGYEYLYQEEDTIFRYNPSTHNFDYLYVFARSIGARWEIQPEPATACLHSRMFSDTVEVDYLGTSRSDNFLFESTGVIDGNYWGFSNHTFGATFLRNIGSRDNPFPVPVQTNCNHPRTTMTLECYADDLRGIAIGQRIPDCAKIITSTSRVEGSLGGQGNGIYKLYPNPTSGLLHLSSLGGTALGLQEGYRISDVMGRSYLERLGEDFPSAGLDLSFLPKGIYFLQIKVGGQWQVLKFVKV